MNFQHVAPVAFPTFEPRNINMMPYVIGDPSSIPAELHGYLPMIEASEIDPSELGKIGYLTTDERIVLEGSHRRGGVHTEGFGSISWGAWGGNRLSWGGGAWGGNRLDWGGGSWGGRKGLVIANSVDESCALYDAAILDTKFGGAVSDEQIADVEPYLMPANNLFWLHDRTPHASLPVAGQRQFFRNVTSEVSVWFSKHSTANPLGVQPAAQIIDVDKFELMAA